MKRVGITGGIGAGKTTVCRIFESLDIPVYYADYHAKEIMVREPEVVSAIRHLLGNEAYAEDGSLRRQWIAQRVFGNEILLQKLNEIVHPAVAKDVHLWFSSLENNGVWPYALEEAALLIESGSYKALDSVIVVTCPEEIRITRVMQREGIGREEVQSRMARQMSESEMVKKAHFLIQNDGSVSLLEQVFSIHQKLIVS